MVVKSFAVFFKAFVGFRFAPPNLQDQAIVLTESSAYKNDLRVNETEGSLAIIVPDTSIWHYSLTEDSTIQSFFVKNRITQIGSTQVSPPQIGSTQICPTQVSFTQVSPTQVSPTQVSPAQRAYLQLCTPQAGRSEIDVFKMSFTHFSPIQAGATQISIIQPSAFQVSSVQVDPSKFGFIQFSIPQHGSTEIGSTQVNVSQVNATQTNSSKIPFPICITPKQFLPVHISTPALTNTYKDNPLTLFDPTFNISFQITNLPTGQLAEAQITNYDTLGRPNGGTILIDDDANGIGWFIDPTPWDNSEFTTTLTDTAFRATTGEAFGKYDLLTTILHETGHLLGIISGNPGFDRYVQTINGTKTFIGDGFTATLTPDGSHLDSKVHPYDLMNNTLAPGVRKLPSWLNLQMINAIRNTTVASNSATQLTAPLTAILLADITNGNFNFTDTTKPEYGWTTRGAATILNQEAVLTEDSPLLSNFSQSYPSGSKLHHPRRSKIPAIHLEKHHLGSKHPPQPQVTHSR